MTYRELNRFLLVVADKAEKKGRELNKSGIMIIKMVMSNVLQYASMEEPMEKADLGRESVSYEELSSAELERICLRAKYNHCLECLCALLTIYCGMRIGELCGLACDDVDMDKMEVYVHSTVHRIRNRDANSDKKTAIVVEEIPRKTQIRTVPIPEILKDYVKGFVKTGTMLIRPKNDEMGVMDPRTLENRLTRVMDAFNDDSCNTRTGFLKYPDNVPATSGHHSYNIRTER